MTRPKTEKKTKPKYRIIETTDENGDIQYSVQEKVLCFWIFSIWVCPAGRHPGRFGEGFGCYHSYLKYAEEEIQVIKSQRIQRERVVGEYD